MNKKNRIEKLKESFTEDKIKELKEGFRKGDKVTKENIQKLKNIEALEERVRQQERKRFKKMIDWLEKNPCKFCGNVKYCVDGETKCERWFEFKQKLKQEEE